MNPSMIPASKSTFIMKGLYVLGGLGCFRARKERQERDKKPAATDEGHVTGSDRKCVSGEAAGLRPCLSDTDTNFLSNATGNEGPSCRSGTRFFVSLSLSFVVARAPTLNIRIKHLYD